MSSSSFGDSAFTPINNRDMSYSPHGLAPLAPFEPHTAIETKTRFFDRKEFSRDYMPTAGPDALPSSSFGSLARSNSECASSSQSAQSSFDSKTALPFGANAVTNSPSVSRSPSTFEGASYSQAALSSSGLQSALSSNLSVATSSPFAMVGKSSSARMSASFVSFGKTSAEVGPSTSSGSFWSNRREAPLPLGAPTALPAPNSLPTLLQGDDVLSKAMNRAITKRKAVFGREDIAADEAVASYLTRMGAPNISTLVNQLSDMAQTSPAGMEFFRHTFKLSVQSSFQSTRSTTPNAPRRTMFTFASKKYSLTPLDQALDNGISVGCVQNGWPPVVSDSIVATILDGRALPDIRQSCQDMLKVYGLLDTKTVDYLMGFVQDEREEWFDGLCKELPAHTFFLPTKKVEERLAQLPRGTHDLFKGREQASINEFSSCCPKRTAKTTVKEAEDDSSPFPILDLPPELRMWALKAALSPGYVSLRSCAHHNPTSTIPNVSPALLRASKQFEHEAKGLLLENTFIVNIWVDNSSRAVIHPKQLPGHILPLIKNLTIVFDFTPMISSNARERDWRPFQRMTGLENLRICGIDTTETTRGYYSRYAGIYMDCMKDVAERVPTSCVISYGSEVKAEEDHIDDMIKTLIKYSRDSSSTRIPSSSSRSIKGCYSMDAKSIEAYAKALADETVQGCKSGSTVDFRYVKAIDEDD